MSLKNGKWFRIVFWAGYSVMIVFSLIPVIKDLHTITLNIVTVKLHFDQLLHILVYFLICLYFAAGRQFGVTLFSNNPLQKFLGAMLFLAVFSEVLQIPVPSRSFNPADIIANIAGIGFGMIVITAARRKLRSESCNQ